MTFHGTARFLSVVLLLGLVGCNSKPTPIQEQQTVSLPEAWTASTTSEAPDWEGLVTPETEALRDLFAQALDQNRDLKLAAARLERAYANARISGADRWPSVSARVGGSREKSNNTLPEPNLVTNTREGFSFGLDLTWEVDLWGRIRDVTSAANLQAEASAFDYESARLSILASVARSWFSIIEAKAQAKLAEERWSTFEANTKKIDAQYQRGLSDALDVRLIRAQTLAAKAELEARKQIVNESVRTLEILLGRYPEGQWSTPTDVPVLTYTVPAGLPSDLLLRRPDLLSAEKRLGAAELAETASKKQWLPRFALTASGGTTSQEVEDLLDRTFSVWGLAGNLTAPLFQGGRIRATIARDEAAFNEALAFYESTLFTALSEVENALSAEQFLSLQADALSAAATASAEAETLAWERYQRGLVDIVTVLDARRRAFDTKSSLLRIKNARWQNRIQLHLALGGEFTE